MRNILLSTCLTLVLAGVASAQRIDSFTTTSIDLFMDEFDEFMNAGKRSSAAELTKNLDRRMSSYTPEQQQLIAQVASKMVASGMSAAPYFEDYLMAMEVVPSTGEKAVSFTEWHEALLQLLSELDNRKFKPYENFLDFSKAFFSDGSLRTGSGLSWFARSNGFDLSIIEGEPVVRFDTVNLVGIRRTDSIEINATRGDYYPATNEFRGKGGRVYWDRLGLTDVYVYLDEYTVDVTSSLYSADSVKMTYPTYFGDERVLGTFSDKISSSSGADNTGSYPRFTSYASVLELTDIGEGLTYTGGFRLHGLNVYGDSETGSPATVELRNEADKLIYRGIADAYIIRRGERIVGDQVEATFYHGSDSIVHPSVIFRYDIPERLLTLTRGERAASRNPFYSSLQDVNIDSEELKVYVEKDSVLFGEKKLAVAKTSDEVEIQSLQYFSAGDYNRYQNIATYNPIAVIKAVAEQEGRVLDGLHLAKKIDSRFSLETVQTLYFDLVKDGFISYDIETKEVTVKDKVFHFVEAAQGKVDFDAMRIRSTTQETNAAFDLQTGSMLLNGVKNLELSRKQRVAIVPLQGQMVMQANRNVDFDGQLIAGYGVFEGKDMHFEYEPYQIKLDSVRFFDLYVPVEVEEGVKAPEPEGLTSRIEHVGGTVLIDAPQNKSGREDIPVFPSLQSERASFVYYDLPSTHDTAYTRDSFYFQLDPFSFNSLDRFTADDVRFEGEMHTSLIFPPYREDIYIREEDRSLGHATQTDAAGWPTYQAKGLFTGVLDLSNKGYYGEGTIDYLTATVAAEDFLFKPKRMTATAEKFEMAEDRTGSPSTPQASGVDVALDWVPYRDSMYVRSEEEPFRVFAAEGHQLEGRLILTPSGLKGQGVHDWPAATLRSKLLSYGPYSAQSDTLSLAIKTESGDAIALEADNLNGLTDFDAGLGKYGANDTFLIVDLPANLYQTSMNEFEWHMAEREITFKSRPDLLGSFVSADPERDSLFFRGATARYNLAGSALEIGGVPYIASADALIYTSDGEITIAEGGKMGQLTNARIIADTITQYHVIDSATVDVQGRKGYTARGYYRYDLEGREQRVLFAEVVGERIGKGSRAEKAAVTRASGEVGEADNFYIDDRTNFKGIISLDASRQPLGFDGYARVDAPGIPSTRWFSLTTLGDKDNLLIPYDLPRAPEGDDLHTGIFLSRDALEAYPLLFMPTHTGQDRHLIDLSEGLLDYRPKDKQFVVGDSLRVVAGAKKGSIMTINEATGAVEASGPLALGNELDYISMRAAGSVSSSFEDPPGSQQHGDLTTTALLSIDLIIPDKLLNLVAADIQATGFDAPDVNYGPKAAFLQDALSNWLEKPSDTSAVVAARGGTFVLPKGETEHSFIFPAVELIYNGEYQSFVSAGDKLDVAYINGTGIHKRITGYMEIKMPGSGDDRLYLYLKSPGESWYFFGFKQGILNVASSSPRFMESLEGMKSKELVEKMDDGELYEIAPVNAGTANSFVNRVKEAQ